VKIEQRVSSILKKNTVLTMSSHKTLALEIAGFVGVVFFAVIVNRYLENKGFKREILNSQKLFENYKCWRDETIKTGSDGLG
jgi:hypothetical protein